MQMIILTVIVLAVIGLLIGILLVSADDAFKVEVDPRETAVRECLPGNNCGACGQAGCDAMAAAIVKGDAPVNGCPVGGTAVSDKISAIMGVSDAGEVDKKVAFVKCAGNCEKMEAKCNYVGIESCEAAAVLPGKGIKNCQHGCLGFGSCQRACPFDAIRMVKGIAQIDREKCKACGKCVAVCPQGIIELLPDKSPYAVQCSGKEKGPIVKKMCSAGCIGCGVCVKQCEEKAITVENNIAHIDYEKCVGCGKCAAKCPQKVILMR